MSVTLTWVALHLAPVVVTAGALTSTRATRALLGKES